MFKKLLLLVAAIWSAIKRSLSRIRQRRGGLPILITIVVFLVVYLLIATKPELRPVAIPEKEWVVEVSTAEVVTVQPMLRLYGLVFSSRQSDLRAQVSGNVVSVGDNYKEGGRLTAGELLLEIDPFDYKNTLAEKKAELKEARSKLELLKRDYIRAKELFAKKDASKQFLDNAELSLDQQQSIITQREIGVKRAERDLQQTKLLAPYDGVIDEVGAQLGMRLSTNDKVAMIIDTKQLEVRFNLSNAQFGRILNEAGTVIGRPIDVVWRVGEKEIRYKGRVDRQGAQISSGTGGVEVYAVIDLLADSPNILRQGAFVEVAIADRTYNDVITVPETAVYDQSMIYIVEEGRLASRLINIIGSNGSDLLIRSSGSPAIIRGDIIVNTKMRESGIGAKVRIFNNDSNKKKEAARIEMAITDNGVS